MAEEKELRKMNRTELIEIIYALKKEEEEVNQKLEEAEQQLQNRTIQIADTGIHPGSGVGNYRNAMTEESLGVPVIGIGVPTVVDAATIVNDTMENFITALEQSQALRSTGEILRSYSAAEKYEFVKELISPHLNGMFVTPKDVDETGRYLSFTISEGLNLAFFDSLIEEDRS